MPRDLFEQTQNRPPRDLFADHGNQSQVYANQADYGQKANNEANVPLDVIERISKETKLTPEQRLALGQEAADIEEQNAFQKKLNLEKLRVQNPYHAQIIEEMSPMNALGVGIGGGFSKIGGVFGGDFSQQDLAELEKLKSIRGESGTGQFVGETAPFLPLGMGISSIAPKTMLGQLAAQSTTGAIEGGTIAKSEGRDPLTGAAIGATIGAAGEVAIPLVAKSMRSIKQAAKAQSELADQAFPQLKETGIRATSGEQAMAEGASESFDMLKAEKALLEQSGEGGDILRSYKRDQSDEIRRYLEKLDPGDADLVGSSVKDAIIKRNSTLKQNRADAYKTLGEVSKEFNVKLSGQPIIDALPDTRGMLDLKDYDPGALSKLKRELAIFGIDNSPEALDMLKREGLDRTPLDVSNAEEFRKQLNSVIGGDPNKYRIVGGLIKAVDDELDLATKELSKSGNPNISALAKEARQSNIALKTEFDEKSLVNQLIDSKAARSNIPRIEESNVYNKLIAKATPMEEFDRVVSSLNKAGASGAAAKNQLKSRVMLDLIDSGFGAKSRTISGERIFGANSFINRYEVLKPKLGKLFSQSEIARLDALARDAKSLIPPNGTIPKGSAGWFMDKLENIGIMTFTGKIPLAGPLVSGFKDLSRLKAAKETAKNATTKRARAVADIRAKQILKRTAPLRELLMSDYPALATVFGVGVANEE